MLIEAIRKLAKDYPDACYPASVCRYTEGLAGPGEGCIVGQGLLAAFPDRFEIAKGLDEDGTFGPQRLLRECGLNYNSLDLRWLEIVQNHQDKGTTWRESVAMTDEYFGLA